MEEATEAEGDRDETMEGVDGVEKAVPVLETQILLPGT